MVQYLQASADDSIVLQATPVSHVRHPQGVINCVAYHRSTGRKLYDVPLNDVSELLDGDADVFVWIGLHEPSDDLMQTVQHEFGLHELAVEDAIRGHQRAKVESFEHILFVLLRTAQLSDSITTQTGTRNASERAIEYGMTALFLSERYIISVRQGPSSSYAGVREHCEAHPEKMRLGPGFVLYSIMDFVVDNFLPITEQLSEHLREHERDIFGGTFNKATLKHLYDLKSELVHFRLIVLPFKDICSYFIYHHDDDATNELMPPDATPYFRDIEDHVLHTLDAIAGLGEMMQVAKDTYLALVGVGQNEIVKKLASWAGILAVPTLIASFYGMNFVNMPELHWQNGYYMAISVMVLASFLLWYRLRKAGWV